MEVFHSPEEYCLYRKLLRRQAERHGVRIWLYCQMPNHVHLIAAPSNRSGLSQAIGEAHRLFSWSVNRRENWCGHLWQERFNSFPTDEAHLLRAIRYVLLNPVRAGLVAKPDEWPNSSARHLLNGTPDALTAKRILANFIEDWPEPLRLPISQDSLTTIRKHSRTGNPLGTAHFQRMVKDSS